MADKSQKMSYPMGEAKGQAQEKGNQMADKAGSFAQSAKESIQQAGQTVMEKAQGAADAVRDATGFNKNCSNQSLLPDTSLKA